MAHHGAGLRQALEREGRAPADAAGIVARLAAGDRTTELAAADGAMLEYAVRLMRTPGAIGGADVERLREAGFDDRAIHDICVIAAYFAFVNRVADGLGVELEERFWRLDGRE